jgi:hypothetical protein
LFSSLVYMVVYTTLAGLVEMAERLAVAAKLSQFPAITCDGRSGAQESYLIARDRGPRGVKKAWLTVL